MNLKVVTNRNVKWNIVFLLDTSHIFLIFIFFNFFTPYFCNSFYYFFVSDFWWGYSFGGFFVLFLRCGSLTNVNLCASTVLDWLVCLYFYFFAVVLPWARNTTHRITLHPYVSVGCGNWSVHCDLQRRPLRVKLCFVTYYFRFVWTNPRSSELCQLQQHLVTQSQTLK